MEYLLKASAVVILFYSCYSLFLKKETFFQHNRWFLLIGLMTALVFPLVVIPVEVIAEPMLIPETAFFTENASPIAATHIEERFQWQDVLPMIYATGLIVFLIQFILQFGSLLLLLFKNPKTKDGIYTYIIVKSKISPFSFFKWIVYNPELFEDEELQLILKHEKVHVRQLHSIDIILTRLACVIFWFNPIMWFYKKHIHQNLEYIADDTTQNAAKNEKDYQHLLVKTSVANQHLPITTNFYNSLIKKRIIMLNKSRSHQKNRWKYVLILPFLTALLLSTNTKEVYVEANSNTTKFESSAVEEPSKLRQGDTGYQLPTPKNSSETVEIIFNKTSSDTYLADIKSQLKNKGVDMVIETLKRNDKGEIYKINITFITENGNANYSVSDPNGIKPFAFKMKGDGSFGVGAVSSNSYFYEDDKDAESKVIIQSNDDEDQETHIITEGEGNNVFYFKGNSKIKNSSDGDYAYVIADTIRMKKEIDSSFWIKRNDGKKDLNAIHRNNVKIIAKSSNSDPLFIVNGKNITKGEVHDLNPNVIESVTVLKDKNATSIYGSEGENGVILVKLKELKTTKNNSTNSYNVVVDEKLKNYNNYLFLLDGKEISKSNLEKVYSKESVASLMVLNEKEGIEKYGEKGKNGVVVVTSNNKDNTDFKIIKDQSPWKDRTTVTGVEFIDDDNPSESGFSYYVTKHTTDKELGNHKSKLESRGINAKFSKIKRNASGEITSIKISLSDESGAKASATWQDDEDTIPKILVGKKGGRLRVSTSTF